MKFKWDKKYLYWGMTLFMSAAAVICFYYLIFYGAAFKISFKGFFAIFAPLINGLAIAFILTPVINGLENKVFIPVYNLIAKKHIKRSDLKQKTKKWMRAGSILLTVILFILIVYALCYMLIPQLASSIQDIITNFDSYISSLTNWINSLIAKHPAVEDFIIDMASRSANTSTEALKREELVTGLIQQYSNEIENFFSTSVVPQIESLIKSLSQGVVTFLKSFWNFFLGFIFAIYILASKELFTGQSKKMMYAFLSRRRANRFMANLRFTNKTFIGFLGGKIVDSIIIGLLCFIGTTLMGTPYAVLVSVIVGITNIIPFFGPYLGAIPSAFIILIVSPIHCLYFIIFILILQQIDGNIIGPKILGDSTGLSGFWVLFSITFFGGLFGVLGMIIGVPTFAVIYAAIKSIINRMLRKKDLSAETEEYIDLDFVNEENQFVEIQPVEKEKKESFFGKIIDKIKTIHSNKTTKK